MKKSKKKTMNMMKMLKKKDGDIRQNELKQFFSFLLYIYVKYIGS